MSVSAHSAGAYTATLLVMVNVVKGGGRALPTLTSQANFTLMIECTPESGRYHSVYSVGETVEDFCSHFCTLWTTVPPRLTEIISVPIEAKG